MLEVYAISGLVIVLVLILGYFFFKKKSSTLKDSKLEESTPLTLRDAGHDSANLEPITSKSPLFKTRNFFKDKLKNAEIGKYEEILLEADLGYTTTRKIIDQLQTKNGGDLKQNLMSVSESLLVNPSELQLHSKPFVISIVGVNGVGKTTTVGKLAQKFSEKGHKVLLGAVDTFRAAATNQLKVWAERTKSDFVHGREGGDPGAVAFDSVSAAKARNIDVVLLDTAGRLHTKSNLMEELKKIHRVIQKVIPEAPHETWLVVDGTMGQNSIQQAKEFQKALNLTGVIVTKLDGTAKGGAVIAISSELNLPVRFIGLGESASDLTEFNPRSFIESIFVS